MGSAGAAPVDSLATARPILEVEAVSKSFGGLKAVLDCSLVVAEGSVTGLIGPNGAGKSTLLGMISGFVPTDSGKIRFRGEEVQNLSPHKRSRIGVVRSFQSARVWAGLTTLENVLVAVTPIADESFVRTFVQWRSIRGAQKSARERAREMLAEFGLDHMRNELAGTLSGGQKRLLEFARIASMEPRLVLLDEPQAGVNAVLGDRMADAVEKMNSRGITVLIVEHNLPFVERLCSRVNVMQLGTTIAAGTMAEMRQHPEVIDAYLGDVDV
jgi:ABC-type branched-subunit amino acid transport system ATPase component